MVEGIPQSPSRTCTISLVSDFSLGAAVAGVAGGSRTNATAAKTRVMNRNMSAYRAATTNLVRRFAGRARLPTWIDKLPIGCDRVDPPEFGPTRQCRMRARACDVLMYCPRGRSARRYVESSKLPMQLRQPAANERRPAADRTARHRPTQNLPPRWQQAALRGRRIRA
jgi:hypothetical protein